MLSDGRALNRTWIGGTPTTPATAALPPPFAPNPDARWRHCRCDLAAPDQKALTQTAWRHGPQARAPAILASTSASGRA